MRKGVVLAGFYITAISIMLMGVFVIHSAVQAEAQVGSVVATPPPTPPHQDIPLSEQTCDELEDTFDYAGSMRQSVEGAYRTLDCEAILASSNASATDKAICESLSNRWTHWNNFATRVRTIAIEKQCRWATGRLPGM